MEEFSAQFFFPDGFLGLWPQGQPRVASAVGPSGQCGGLCQAMPGPKRGRGWGGVPCDKVNSSPGKVSQNGHETNNH